MWHDIPQSMPPMNKMLWLYVRFHLSGAEWYDYLSGELRDTGQYQDWRINYNLDYASFFVVAWMEIPPYKENS